MKSVSDANIFLGMQTQSSVQSKDTPISGLGTMSLLTPEMKPMSTQNYVSILKRRDQESNLCRNALDTKTNFAPKMIGGKVGTLLDLQQRENGVPLIEKFSKHKNLQRRKTMMNVNLGGLNRQSTKRLDNLL